MHPIESIVLVGFLVALLYFIRNRHEEKKKENFEERDN